jgi:S-adenosylmethionine synthetase
MENNEMIEKVNPSHPDKVADRIAGAIVDLAYTKEENPKIAVEVLIGHSVCHIIIETSVEFTKIEISEIVKRIAGNGMHTDIQVVPQDKHLAGNQEKEIRCGDNGIFKGVPLTDNEKIISKVAREIYEVYPYDGKYILTDDKFICCQSNAKNEELKKLFEYVKGRNIIINPLGEWTGGTDVDTGATNRKLGSDMAQSVTGGGLHGKDLSKADVSVNIYAFLKAQETGEVVELCCAIGDDIIDGKPYSEIVEIARNYINEIGGFEKFAEWGLF